MVNTNATGLDDFYYDMIACEWRLRHDDPSRREPWIRDLQEEMMDCYQYGTVPRPPDFPVEEFPVKELPCTCHVSQHDYHCPRHDGPVNSNFGLHPKLGKWDKRYIKLAKEVSGWSKDGTKVGAVLVRPDKSLVSVGFNGLVPGMDDALLADREFKNLCVRHAEVNALWFGRYEPSFAGYTMYIHGWPGPCGNCAAAIVMAKLGRIVGVYENEAKSEWDKSIEAARVVLKAGNVQLEAYRFRDIDFSE